MNHCYYCSTPVDRLPYDGAFRACEKCKARGRPRAGKREVTTNIADFWTKKPSGEQAKLAAFYNEPEPLTGEEKREMEGRGA